MKGLFIVPSDYDSLAAKGVLGIMAQRDEGGLLDRVWTLHPFALYDREIEITKDHLLIERKQRPLPRWRVVAWLNFFRHLRSCIWLVRALIRQNGIDFVRAQDPFYSGIIGFFGCWSTPAKFCISLHADYEKMHEMDAANGAPKIFGSRRLAQKLEHFLLGHADRVLVISDYMTRYAIRRGASPSSVRLFRHLISLNASTREFPQVISNSAETPIVALVSRLNHEKSILDVAEIVDELRRLGMVFQVQIAGDGPQRAELEAAIRRNGNDQYVRLLGFQTSEQVRELLGRASASVVFIGGASLIEGAAMACPTVAYDCEWHSELIKHGETGLLVPEHDGAAAAKALARLLSDRDLAMSLGQALRANVLAKYDEGRLLEARRTVYRELVGMAQPTIDQGQFRL